MKKTILLSILCCLLGSITQAQITRGAVPGEIYISAGWYFENGIIHKVIFHSADNGETLTIQYEATDPPYGGEMGIEKVLGDATPGVLYNYGIYDNYELWVSFDYGVNWEYKEDFPGSTYYLSGLNSGVIFKTSWLKLHRSEDFGQNFEIITDPLTIPIPEIGFIDGEFFGLNGGGGKDLI
ncbi:MAG: hypothetical protein JEY97_12455 [Bacteroidales bacterium]|nr:hypothetical protein [Bacteroidales bacterium]